jgi:hypothetical protein
LVDWEMVEWSSWEMVELGIGNGERGMMVGPSYVAAVFCGWQVVELGKT